MSKEANAKKALFLKRRHQKEFLTRWLGRIIILFSLMVLGTLLATIAKNGYTAFFQTRLILTAPFQPPASLESTLESEALLDLLITRFCNRNHLENKEDSLSSLISWGAIKALQTYISKAPQQQPLTVPLNGYADQFYKSFLRLRPFAHYQISTSEESLLHELIQQKHIFLAFNVDFFVRGDSQEPELAGFYGALMGSLYTLGVALLFSFPLGVGAGIYLEEFAPRNRLTDWIELHINNLAAVPSIVFGLLGFMVFDKILQFPRPSSLLGGATLSLMMCPPLIIVTRLALRTIPTLLREAAYALGASTVQVVFHQMIPIAFPSILSGSMLVIARIIGESAPLLMVGMVAFIADIPQSITDPATVLPIQIFSWAKNPHIGFLEKTSGAILGLLAFLLLLNVIALLIRQFVEHRVTR